MNQKIHPVTPVLGFLALSAAITFGLHQLGRAPWLQVDWSHLGMWLDVTMPTEALLAAVRVVGLGCSWWLLLSTCFYLAARWCRSAAALRIATPLTPPFIRSLGTRVVAGAVAVSTLANGVPALAWTDRSPQAGQLGSYPAPTGASLPVAASPQTPELDPFLFPLPSLDAGPGSIPPTAVAEGEGMEMTHPRLSKGLPLTPGDQYRIVAGDHLWSIARRALAQAMDRPPTTAQITSYWVDLIEANRETIRSADPNLIYPGEKVLLPQIRVVKPSP